MAKITARGAHEVARWRTTRTVPSDIAGLIEVEYLWVLRSDGALLVRTSRYDGRTESGSYSIKGKVTRPVSERIGWVSNYLRKRFDDVVMVSR